MKTNKPEKEEEKTDPNEVLVKARPPMVAELTHGRLYALLEACNQGREDGTAAEWCAVSLVYSHRFRELDEKVTNLRAAIIKGRCGAAMQKLAIKETNELLGLNDAEAQIKMTEVVTGEGADIFSSIFGGKGN